MLGADLMEAICDRDNLRAALKRVRQNKGGPGVDGMTVDALPGYLKGHWPRIKERLLRGEYRLKSVKRVGIPKPGRVGERRKLAPESLRRFKAWVRGLTRRNWSISLEDRVHRLSSYLLGWRGYFVYCETRSVLRDLDSWIRRRLPCVQWKQWKVYRRRKCELIRLGIDLEFARVTAWRAKGPLRPKSTAECSYCPPK